MKRQGSCGHREESFAIEEDESGQPSLSLSPEHTVQGRRRNPQEDESEESVGRKEGDDWVFRGSFKPHGLGAARLEVV